MGATQTQPAYQRGLDFEQVWAALMENRNQLKETDRIMKENAQRQKEDRVQLKEADKRQEKKSMKTWGI